VLAGPLVLLGLVVLPLLALLAFLAIEVFLLYTESKSPGRLRGGVNGKIMRALTWKYLASILFGLIHSMLRNHEVKVDLAWCLPQPICETCRIAWTAEGRVREARR